MISILILLSPHLSSFNGDILFQGNGISDSHLFSSQYEVTINQTFGGSMLDYSYSVISSTDGGYVLAGYSYSYGAGESDLWLLKTDTHGYEEWNQVVGGSGEEFGSSVIATSHGYIVLGGTESYGAGDYDLWLLKTNTTGQVEWNRTIGGLGPEYAFSVIESSDGGFVLAGRTESYGAGGTDAWLVKTDTFGRVEWNRTFGGLMNDDTSCVLATTDGGYVLVGGTASYGAGDMDAWLVKSNTNGEIEWDQTFGGEREDRASAIISTSDGGFVLTGLTQSYSVGGRDVWLIKTNGTGYPEWNQTFGGNGHDTADSILKTPEGGYLLAGRTESFGAGMTDMWLIKTTPTGQLEWNQTFGGAEEEAAYSIIATVDGGYVIVGRTASYSVGQSDTWLIKLIPQGVTSQTAMTSISSASSSNSSSLSKSTPSFSSIVFICCTFIIVMGRRGKLRT
jgi:hypothetical protein